jgi:hypothetical protein
MQNTTANTLAEMGQIMKQWRAQKKHANEKIPDALRSQLLEMLTKYPPNTVAQVLCLSHSTIFALRKMQHTLSSNQTAPEQKDVDFIPFKLPASLAPDTHAAVTKYQILHPNGAKLLIDSGDLCNIIQAFLCCK